MVILAVVSASNAINATLFANLKFDFIRDIVPISGVVTFPMVITVNASFPAKNFPELLAYAKANPGKINIGTPPLGSPQHVAGELLKMMTGADIVFVAYRGGPAAISDALSGQIQGAIGTVLLTLPQIKSGGLRAVAVTSTARSVLLPEIPTVDQFVPGFEAGQWVGIGAPKKIPVEIVERLNREINAGMADATFKARIADLGGVPCRARPPISASLSPPKPRSGVTSSRSQKSSRNKDQRRSLAMDAGASGRTVRCANCGSPNVTNRTEHVVLISAQIGRTLGRSVAWRGVYDVEGWGVR